MDAWMSIYPWVELANVWQLEDETVWAKQMDWNWNIT